MRWVWLAYDKQEAMVEAQAFKENPKPETPGNDIGDKLVREAQLLASLPSGVANGFIDRAKDAWDHKFLTGVELASSFAVAAGLAVASKNPGWIGDAALLAPKVFAAFTVADLSHRMVGPMHDTWVHPTNLDRDKAWLSKGMGSAAFDYPLVAATGLAGGKVGAKILPEMPTRMSIDPEPRGPGKWATTAAHSRLLGKFSLNAPLVLGFGALEQHLYPDPGDNPDFPNILVTPPPETFIPLSDQPTSVIPKEGIHINAKNSTSTFGINVTDSGPVRLSLDAAAPGTNWGKENAESAVLSIYVDGRYHQDAVLFGGDKKTNYGFDLGELPAGEHTVTLRYAKEKSTTGATSIDVDAGTALEPAFKSDEDKWIARYAPILVGRHGLDNTFTDTPLGMYHTTAHNSDGTTTIKYGYVFSNEDAGNAAQPSYEQAFWGRLTDMQPVFSVTVDENGHLVREQYEGLQHIQHDFHGDHDGTHAVIQVVSNNNLVSDRTFGSLRFRQPPQYSAPRQLPLEDLMRTNPEWFRVEQQELEREGKIDLRGVGDDPYGTVLGQAWQWVEAHVLGERSQMADPRNYVYIQFDAVHADGGPISARVTLKNGNQRDADFERKDVAIDRNGWSQTAVLLPPGTSPGDIKKIDFQSRGDGSGKVIKTGHIYMLDKDFKPQEVDAPVAL